MIWRVEDICSKTTTTTQLIFLECLLSTRVYVCVPPQACIRTPSTILHTSCLSVFCAALSAPRPACLSRRARSLQNDILPAKTARIWISEPLIETLWLQIGGAQPPQTPPLSFSAPPRPRVCEKLGGGFNTFSESKQSELAGCVFQICDEGASLIIW